ncbi:MAG TPA: GldG family protein [Vicinamibacteria bacterium]|nr:GldG family protein [Vicinamibacteria bacterium]
MKRAIDFLAPLGLLVIVGSLFWARAGKTLPGGWGPYLLAGFALALAHLVLRWEDVVGTVGRRQMKYGTNTLVLAVVVLLILGMANYLVYRHTHRFDLTKGQRYSLSDQTRKVLTALKEDVKVTYFARGRDLTRGQDRLKEFQAVTPKIQADFVDPVANPARAQVYDVRGPWPILVVEKGTSRERINNDTEQDITNALIKVTRDKKKTVCLAEGEGERAEDDTGEHGFSAAKAALAKNQYETKKVLLLREKKVPSECTVLVVAGREKDLLPEAVDAIRSFVKAGGKALLMVEPELKEAYPNLVALLKEWNIQAGKDVVVDVSGIGQLFGANELTPIVGPPYPYHEITKDFRIMTAFSMARSMEAGKGSVEGVTAQNLLQTSPQSWAESDLSLKGRIEFNEGKDRRGPISLGVAATIRGPEPVPSPSPSPSPGAEPPPKPPEGRVVAVGDSDFASNWMLGFEGNKDFFLNAMAWLSEDADLIAIRPKEPDDQRLFLTRQQQLNVAWVALVLLPGAFVVAGISTWWRRR